MLVAIHQPTFLPWLGYLDKMQQADLFIILDHVQFSRGDYQNRTRIRLGDMAHWLTVPVQQRSPQERIADKEIDYPGGHMPASWSRSLGKTMSQAYQRADFVHQYQPELQAMIDARWRRLVDLDLATLGLIRDAFGIRTPMLLSSDLQVPGSKSELVLNLCREVGADTYLAGMGGSQYYLDRPAFAEAGVNIAWQDFCHPVYSQCRKSDFVPGLSSVDLLLNHGPNSRAILWPEYGAVPGKPSETARAAA